MIGAGERAAMEASVRGALSSSGDVDATLATLGWREMLREQTNDAIGIVFAALGATNATSTALDDVLTYALGLDPSPEVAVLLPPFGTWDAPGHIEGDTLHGSGLATARAASAHQLLVACAGGAGTRRIVVPATGADVRPVHGVDPDGRLHAIRIRAGARAAVDLDPAAWSSATALAQRALAHEIAGACRTMLDLARTHALERAQFGRPIARFQAVRHRLADALVAIEALEATLDAARDEPGPLTAALAKAVAGRTGRTVGGHCQQVLAGVGFTTEHRFHRFLKRTLALEGLFGSADRIVLDVGRGLLAARQVPTLIEL